ncbi:sodium/proline symporter PutP [Caldalkalibacillus salinus]|uniref:sodium/proline symporter PutP n=1 Tax=Caldalkalibacillus salinus TaxID=2803787 RepID=UPI001923AE8A|nr:sodium/proline symporter PutP [Caldalkalibacillus salinus]
MESVEATYIAFLLYLVIMLAIGIITYRMTNTLSDYVLGGRKLNSWVAAISAQASDMSGWLLLGLPGAAYASGMGMWSIWIAIGLATGTMLNWRYIAKRLRRYTELAGNSITLSEYFENRFRDKSHILRIISAVFILIFFLFYTASGLVAGGKLFEATFGMEYHTALIIGSIVIIAYTFLGGFLAVSWTDFIQGILMFLALIVAPIIAIVELGGFGQIFAQIGAANPDLLDVSMDVSLDENGDWTTVNTLSLVGIVSALAWGLGYFGQPHILARFMAIRKPEEVRKARLISIVWVVLSLYGAIMVGFVGIAVFGTDTPLGDPEKVFIELVQYAFHPWIAGFLLAAVLAAIMSTIDSQLLVSSSALTEDFYRQFVRRDASEQELVWIGRLAVLLIALIAVYLAWEEGSVLELVSYAWAGFGAAFGPAVVLSLFWKRMTGSGAVAGMIVGGLTVILWEGTSYELYSIVPGFIFSAITIYAVSIVEGAPSQEIQDEFEQAKKKLASEH